MIMWRATEFCKSAIIYVIMGLRDNFTVRAQKCRSDRTTILISEIKGDALIISIIREAKNDDYEASDSVLQSGHHLGSNAVQREF